MTPETQWSAPRLWLAALAPLALLAVLVAVVVKTNPGDRLRGGAVPPVERLSIDRAQLGPDGIVLSVLNDGPDPVTIAQVVVDDAYWAFTSSNGAVLKHLGRTALTIPYPWVEGEAHLIKILTSTGTAFEHEIPVATQSPRPDVRYFFTFALIGLYVGVIPVALGLLWFPLASRIGPRGLDILLALTVGLLAFLLIDTIEEGLDSVSLLPSSFQGLALFIAAAAGAWLDSISWVMAEGASTKNRTAGTLSCGRAARRVDRSSQVGEARHRAAFRSAQRPLGTLLIIGFMLHNTTEGLAIIAPIARERPSLLTLARLGAIGGVPTIAGAWLGGLVYSPVAAVLCLGLGAGAIGQVIHLVARQMAGSETVLARFASAPVAAGLFGGFFIMYATGLLVG